MSLIEEMESERKDQMRWEAMLQRGIDIDKKDSQQSTRNEAIFKDPSAYAHLTPQERNDLTAKMKNQLKAFVKGTGMGEKDATRL